MPARLFLRGKPGKQTWWVDLGKIRGVRRRISLQLPRSCKDEAEAVASTLVLRRAAGGDAGLLATLSRMRSQLSFAEAFADLMAHVRANKERPQSTIDRYEAAWRQLSRILGTETSLHDIDERAITAYRARRIRDGIGTHTLNAELITLSAIFTRAHELGHGDKRKIKLDKVHQKADRVLNQDEIDRYIGACSDWYQCAAILALDTGARIRSEIVPLRREQVDLERRMLRIDGRKTYLRRSVPLSDACIEAIREQQQRAPFGVYLFPAAVTVDGRTRGESGYVADLRYRHAQALRDSGVAPFGPHVLRHTWATRLMETGKVSLRTLQRLGGWASLRMVERYSHVEEAAERRAIEALPALAVAQLRNNGSRTGVRRARRIAQFPGGAADE